MITKEEIEKRQADLEKELNDFVTKAQAQINVYTGAIQNCRDLLNPPSNDISGEQPSEVAPQE